MKKLITLLLIVLPVIGYGQNYNDVDTLYGNLNDYMSIPEVTWYDLEDNRISGTYEEYYAYVDSTQQIIFESRLIKTLKEYQKTLYVDSIFNYYIPSYFYSDSGYYDVNPPDNEITLREFLNWLENKNK